MILEFSQGKLIANPNELMVRLNGPGRITLQAAADAVELVGIANVVTAFGGGISWSVQLDSHDQLEALAEELGLEIKGAR
ncbi:DUF3389 domain-containing protein [Ferrimonas balearica]|uniref:DUF3389 domain-containing protein n=1 Tax=Ferrimonas balearica TaxID=44012 RepID=UPI001C9987EC|nr:DUF3389 domain-containing protein [Ferrimonas balearica]MBY5922970.1 DUF3389 domain-containing protein [Ferrimonas balearica]MBY5997653.1 DUF3389 domain-containing protein [Ferrimonas balearica]